MTDPHSLHDPQNLMLIFDSVQVGLMLIDESGMVSRVNRSFAAFVDHDPAELIAMRPGEALSCAALHNTDHRCGETPSCKLCPVRNLFTRVLAENTTIADQEFKTEIMANGRIKQIWLNATGTVLQLDESRYAVLSILDITSRKTMEMTLAQAKEEAESADRAKSDFLASMSHEIRTPMTAILGAMDLLKSTELTVQQRRYVDIGFRSGEALLSLINDILDFSKISAGKMQLERADFNLVDLLEETTEMLAVRAQEKGLEIVCIIDPAVAGNVRGDSHRLQQILTNLGGNAVKFTERGSITLSVTPGDLSGAGSGVRFEIRDTGIGIPAMHQAQLFSPFVQADASSTRRFGGTGLGLAISKQIVEMMGGTIGLESREGVGSTFWFTVSLETGAPDGALETPDIAGLKVLAVDRSAENLSLVCTALTGWGCRIDAVPDASAALEPLKAGAAGGAPYDVVLIDFQPEGAQSELLAQRIRSLPELSGVRLVVMTTLGQRDDAIWLKQAGFSGFLTKPIRRSLLHKCLASIRGQEKKLESLPLSSPARASLRPAAVGARILLVEDTEINQLLCRMILEKMGHHVDVVGNGKAAISALIQNRYDLVIMDCQMPIMDGFEASRRIREGAAGAEAARLPIIAMTAYSLQGDRERCIEAGMSDYLTKPIQPDIIAAMLEAWLKPARAALAVAPAVGSTTPRFANSSVSRNRQKIFDPDIFKARVSNDITLAAELVAIFLKDMPAQLESLIESVAVGDTGEVHRMAHRIKGSTAALEGLAMRDIAAEIERTAKEGRLEGVPARIEDLERAFDALRLELLRFTRV